jgi:hypothetical protein
MLRWFAAGAVITFGLALAIFGGVMFGRAVSTPAEVTPRTSAERTDLAFDSPVEKNEKLWPSDDLAADAVRIAKSREGTVSFAAFGPGGAMVDFEPNRQFFSASVSKAMLLVAELRRLRREEARLDAHTQELLRQMITLSDNDAADEIYERVGDPGLNEVAEIARMTDFGGNVGHWSNVKLTAADLARFMDGLDGLLDLPHGKAGSEMLSGVIPAQSWGIPQAAPVGARVRFKGGWRPSESGQLVHQVARIDVDGESYSIAVLTDGNPNQPYGEETIRRIATELLP